ncbi:MAG: tRNA-dihydrouridine synthase family protein [Bacteroidales bacterium]|nr:tRNA-dihydrouridine synthase family protein [Bacteroidales bacterium]
MTTPIPAAQGENAALSVSLSRYKLFFAPLQGYTHLAFRRAHHSLVGGVDAYFTPFLRIEHGSLRKKDLYDLDPLANDGIPTVPQIIVKNRDEMCFLCDALQHLGWHRIDINMGCPFPLQTGAGRGAALLSHPERVEPLLREVSKRPDVAFSIKMRLGMDHADEALRLLPLLNEAPLHSITLHPRLATQQYRGAVSLDDFSRFYDSCRHPLIFNGDILSVSDISSLASRFPSLYGFMIGRGLLRIPTMHLPALSSEQRIQALFSLHDAIYSDAMRRLQGPQQQLNHLSAFWHYQEDQLPKKIYKKLTKAGSLRNYDSALSQLKVQLSS